MCTAISFLTKDHYFGRNLDLEHSYRETVTITPRGYTFSYRKAKAPERQFAMIGMATVTENYPLYYDATNEKGLSMAGLNFPGNAVYLEEMPQKLNLAPFELIPYVLSSCENLQEAKQLLQRINLVSEPFNKAFPLTPLHWLVSDKSGSLTVEPLMGGLHICENPVGVLTNNPPFDYQMHNLANYLNLTSREPENRLSDKITLKPYSRGMGAMGLPGDLSSPSRFVRAAFTKLNSRCKEDETSSVSQFFHILGTVTQQEGCVKVGDAYEKTIYSSCCNTDKGIYYYTTYENRQITAVYLHNTPLNADRLFRYPLVSGQQIRIENPSMWN
jgi:choloylglycine hydrolase